MSFARKGIELGVLARLHVHRASVVTPGKRNPVQSATPSIVELRNLRLIITYITSVSQVPLPVRLRFQLIVAAFRLCYSLYPACVLAYFPGLCPHTC